MIDLLRAAEVAAAAAREASALVMSVYATAFEVFYKAKDDPVTRADREANELLCQRLSRAFPGLPVVAEESDTASYAGFASADAVWFVDPLDGTREFVERNGEFSIMIGLAQGGRAKIGVVAAPAWSRTFAGVVGHGAWEEGPDGARTAIHVTERAELYGASVVVSRSRPPARLASILARMGVHAAATHGSSGLKGALVAIGTHDVYLHPGRAGMRWDACATDALVRAAGGMCTQADGTDIDYADEDLINSKGLVATNGRLHASVVGILREA